jgi:hypothetical protein
VGVLGSLFSLSTAVPADHAGVRPGNGKLPRGGLLLLKANAVLVIVLGFVMLTRGLTLFGVALPRVNEDTTVAVAQISGSVQEVKTTVRKGQYHPFIVQSGIPARWIVSAKAEDLDNCNNPS